ncbi:sensor histidine kinase [Dyadobacter psychrotolerans]|uniref:histidine kinase n=1 Tax=Dyadobacter psychrotolerans TaxID=2541721 RepID=A0A4R5DJW9_9BACT|nr:HAMP domain-containing sensor histidine kinase [Dyadobacter psychrotolerans]TDE14432.1 hypothetical protein E0F88_14620 [Dyadobacter psychrotolerans]
MTSKESYFPVLNKILFFLVVCLTTRPAELHAQTSIIERYTLTQYTDENGLPQNSVKSIAADQEGFVWLATENGLVRYDGHHFYTYDKFNLNIEDSRVYAVQRSINGKERETLYAGTAFGKNEFLRIENGRAVKDTLYALNSFWSKPHVKEGHINTFIASGLPTILRKYGASQQHYAVPLIDDHGSYYICDKDKVTLYSKNIKAPAIPFATNTFLNFFLIGKQLYHYSENGKIHRFETSRTTELLLKGDILKNASYKGTKQGVEIYWNNTNDQTFLYLNKCLYVLEKGNGGHMNTMLIVRDFDLLAHNIFSVYYNSPNKKLFLGSITQGLFVIENQPFKTLVTPGGEMENVFYAQTAFGKNAVLTSGGIILGQNENTKQTEYQYLPALQKEHAYDKRGILTDVQGNIWIKNGARLDLFNSSGTKLINKWEVGDELKQIYLAKNGLIWIGLKHKGLYFIDPLNAQTGPKLFLSKDLTAISFITSKTENVLLVGTEHGLYEVNVVSKTSLFIKGTERTFIRSIYVARQDAIWITSLDKGIQLYGKHGIVTFPLDKKRYLALAHCITEDLNGFFWIPANRGLFRIKKEDLLHYAAEKATGRALETLDSDLYYHYFDKRKGFLTNEFNGGCQPCGLQLDNGYLSFPSLKGLVWFIPDETSGTLPSGKIFADRVEYNNHSFPILTDTVRLPLTPRNVRFRFAIPFFGSSDNINVSYALIKDGEYKKTDWNPVNSQDISIYFSSLSSGEYTLYLKKLNGFGKDNVTIKKIHISVPLLWHETWWTRLIFTLLVILGLYLYVRWRLNKVKHENRRLEIKIASRTSDLQISRDQQEKQLRIMSRLITSMSHDIRSPLNYIGRTSRQISTLIKKGEFDEVAEIGDLITDSTQNMSLLIKNLLDYIKAYVYGRTMKFEPIHLKNLVETKLLVFKNIAELGKNRISVSIPDDLNVHSDAQMLGIIVHNLIDNAIKYTSEGTIQICAGSQSELDVTKDKEGIYLVFSNNGFPLSATLLEMFNRDNNEGTIEPESDAGLGSFLIKEISELISVRLNVTQTETTNFYLLFDKEQ